MSKRRAASNNLRSKGIIVAGAVLGGFVQKELPELKRTVCFVNVAATFFFLLSFLVRTREKVRMRMRVVSSPPFRFQISPVSLMMIAR